MATTFKAVLEQPRQDGTQLLTIRITHNRVVKRVGSANPAHYLTAKDWNEEKKEKPVRKSYPLHLQANNWIEATILKGKRFVAELEKEGRHISAELIQAHLQGRTLDKTNSFLDFIASYLEECKTLVEKGKMARNTMLDFQSAYRYLKKFNKDRDLLFSELTADFAQRFSKFVADHPHPLHPTRKLSPNTISEKIGSISRLYKVAIKQGHTVRANVFEKQGYSRTMSQKIRLNEEEIRRLENLALPRGETIDHARNVFLMNYYCAGSRIGDMLMIRKNNVEWKTDESGQRLPYRLNYITIKGAAGKGGKAKSIKLPRQAIDLLLLYLTDDKQTDELIFPLLRAKGRDLNQRMIRDRAIKFKTNNINGYLKEIARMAGITKNLSTHLARHSFAQLARKKTKDVKIVMDLLGHEKLSTTQIYLNELDSIEQDSAMDDIFS